MVQFCRLFVTELTSLCVPRERFKKMYEFLNLRALKFSSLLKIWFFMVCVKYVGRNFNVSYPLNVTQNILPIHLKIGNLLRSENLRTPRFTNSFNKPNFKRPPELLLENPVKSKCEDYDGPGGSFIWSTKQGWQKTYSCVVQRNFLCTCNVIFMKFTWS